MREFIPKDPDFAARVEASFARMQVMGKFGARPVLCTPGHMEIGLDFDAGLTQQHGFLHAGVTTTLMDTACGFAAASLMSRDSGVLTVEFKVNLLSPGIGERFRFTGDVLKPGRTISVCEGRAFGFDATGDEKLFASMTATIMTINDQDHIKG